jgi:peptidoglycan/LPS O-acetylase OafA/YrhL
MPTAAGPSTGRCFRLVLLLRKTAILTYTSPQNALCGRILMEKISIEAEPAVVPGATSRLSAVWTPRKLSTSASASLDVMRGVAACAVMFGHLRTLFFVNFSQVEGKTRSLEALYFLTGFGHQAVMVFFVLSGFLISSTVLRSLVSRDWSWRDYAINRATRLYVVLVPGLLLGFFWDRLGSGLFASQGIYAHPLEDLGTSVPLQNLNLPTFLGNLLFLQTIFCRTFGSNGPLWSLSNEFWYYVLFPVGLGAALAWIGRRFRGAVFLTCLAAAVCFLEDLAGLLGFLIWLSGVAVVLLHSSVRINSRRISFVILLCVCLLLGGAFFASRSVWEASLRGDLAVGLAFALFLFGVLLYAGGESSPHYAAVAHHLAGFSYSLYVLHFPLLLFLRCWLVPAERWQPTVSHLFEAGAVGTGCLVYAWLISLFTEKKTDVTRRRVKRLFA